MAMSRGRLDRRSCQVRSRLLRDIVSTQLCLPESLAPAARIRWRIGHARSCSHARSLILLPAARPGTDELRFNNEGDPDCFTLCGIEQRVCTLHQLRLRNSRSDTFYRIVRGDSSSGARIGPCQLETSKLRLASGRPLRYSSW